MWVAEGILSEFYSQFISCFFSEVDKRTFVVGDKIVNSTPDLVYCHSARILESGPNLQKTLLFVVEVFISELTVVNIHIVSFSLLFY